MHVCLIGIEYPPDTDFGGISTYQYLLAKELEKRKINVTVICGTNKSDYDYFDGSIHVIRLHTVRDQETVESFLNYRKKVAKTVLKINQDNKIDIIESPEFSGETLDCFDNVNIPIVIKLHTSYLIWSDLNNCKLPGKLHVNVVNAENEVLKKANAIICCSKALKKLMSKYYDISLKKIEVVPNVADLNRFFPISNNHKSNKILYCGALEPRKGINVLANAIPKVLDKIPEAIFEFVGDLKNKDNLTKLIPKKYHDSLVFVDRISNNVLNDYYNEARIGIIPSLFDSFPYVALEALSTELPIVASDNTGVKEMIIDNESGLLYKNGNAIDLADKIIELYFDVEKQHKFGICGREAVLNKYSPDVLVNEIIDIYKRVIYEYGK